MKNLRSARQQETGGQAQGRVATPNLQALHRCESRIKELQNLTACRDREGWQHRNTQLCRLVDSAVQAARRCAMEGDFRQVGSGTLAGTVNNFSKMRQYPVSHGIDVILGCLERELEQRGCEGSLAHWPAQHLALVTNGLSKGGGPRIQQGLSCLAQALLEVELLTLEQDWTPRHLALMANGLSKGEREGEGERGGEGGERRRERGGEWPGEKREGERERGREKERGRERESTLATPWLIWHRP